MNPPSSQPGRHILDGTIRISLAQALILPTGLITAGFLTRHLGPEQYGLFVLASTLTAWIDWIIASLFSRATIKFVGEAEDWRSVGEAVVRLHLLTGGGSALLLWLLAPFIARALNEPALSHYLRLFAVDIPLFSLAQAHSNILIGMGNFRQRAVVSAGRWIARLALIVLLVEIGLSISGAILGSIGASLAELAICRLYVRPALFRASVFPTRHLWDYAVPLFLSALSMGLVNKVDLIMLKLLGGTATQAGIYGAAQNLAVVPGVLTNSFSPLLLSTLSSVLYTGEGPVARELGRSSMRVAIVLLPFAAMTAGAASEIASLVFGRIFSPAGAPLALLIFAALALVMISVALTILTAAGRPRWCFALVGPLVPLAIIGHELLIPRFGLFGASLVTTFFTCLGALSSVVAVYHLWGIYPPLGTLARSLLVCGIAYIVAAYWPAPGFLLLVKLPVVGLVIGLSFLFLGEFSRDELALVRSLVQWKTLVQEHPRQVKSTGESHSGLE